MRGVFSPPAKAGRAAAWALAVIGLLGLAAQRPAAAGEDIIEWSGIEWSGRAGIEGRIFFKDPVFPGQRTHNGSVFLEPEAAFYLANGPSLTAKLFARIDTGDIARTHIDVREFVLTWPTGPWIFRLGVDKVFWGRAEIRHLVDFVNQTDLVEAFDEEEKLGQPMARVTYLGDWGTIDLFALPFFRKRTFPGAGGRQRSEPPVDEGRAIFEADSGADHVDFAARYSHVLDKLDFGVSFFRGTSREPSFRPIETPKGARLQPVYDIVEQASLDLQVTEGPWLFKLEALNRWGQRDLRGREETYFSTVAGLEYTIFGLAGSSFDLGFFAEWMYDDRDRDALTIYEGDIAFGLRLSPNGLSGAQLLAGVVQDLDSNQRVLVLEASRRLSGGLSVNLEALVFAAGKSAEILNFLARDDHVRIEFVYNY